MIHRGYVMTDLPGDFEGEDGEQPSFEREAREALVADLANKWSIHNCELERARWELADSEAREWYYEHLAERVENRVLAEEDRLGRKLTEEEEERIGEAVDAELRAQDPIHKHRTAMDLIEVQLGFLQARMMRPYEHHNEEEGYWEYMESRAEARDYDY